MFFAGWCYNYGAILPLNSHTFHIIIAAIVPLQFTKWLQRKPSNVGKAVEVHSGHTCFGSSGLIKWEFLGMWADGLKKLPTCALDIALSFCWGGCRISACWCCSCGKSQSTNCSLSCPPPLEKIYLFITVCEPCILAKPLSFSRDKEGNSS